MKKEIIKEEIFSKRYNGVIDGIRVSELPENLLPTDIINLITDNGYYSENESWDPFSELIVYREREETNEEFISRKNKLAILLEESKQKRFEEYKKLKKEFNNK